MLKRYTFVATHNNPDLSSCLFMRKNNQWKAGWREKEDGKKTTGRGRREKAFETRGVIPDPLKYQDPDENCWCPKKTLSKMSHSSRTKHPGKVKKMYRCNTVRLGKLSVLLDTHFEKFSHLIRLTA